MTNWDLNLTNLRDVLADMYWNSNLARTITKAAGLNPNIIAITDNPTVTWFNILENARLRNKVSDVIDEALKDYPENDLLKMAKQNNLVSIRGADITTTINWQAPSEPDVIEKLMDKQNTMLPIGWLDAGLERARSVVRVIVPGGVGSGFVTDTGLLITNNHVIANEAQARDAVIQFNYQKTWQGLDQLPSELKLAPENGFTTSNEDDWTGVHIAGDWQSASGSMGLKLSKLPPNTPKKDDFTVIIQHPGGGPKQIALYHNVITYADTKRVQYLTDTLPGSSGSPVFNTEWHVVALHHSGGWLKEPDTKLQVYRNEGIHIDVVLSGLKAKGLYN